MNNRFEAVLVHGYRFPYQRGESDIGNRNRLQAAAAEQLVHEGSTDTLLVAGGHWFGEKAPPFAKIFSKELTRRDLSANVITVPNGNSTSAELDVLLEHVAREGWSSVATLATRDHGKRVRLLRDRQAPKVATLVAEDILDEALTSNGMPPNAHREAVDLVTFFAEPQNTTAFRKKEQILTGVTKLHLDGALTLAQRVPGVWQLQNIIDG